ncbi:HAMP domain-containing sensor histidine kinase [uncultured Oscillibacter sp.]|uniref:sensor histidine kinase n=1 Tax=uncultured Oscillibacter sp. TaxID=876091 RepID=UPI002634E53A|nr:HAMP domain-containing sensor histidine kinase [uncultured Oscillibacter sp.]
MKELFSLRTVQKKIVMLSKLAGIVLIFSYILSTRLPVNEDASFLLWLGFVLLLVLGIDFFMGRFITKPIDKLNASAKRMAELDFSAPCGLASTDEFGELSASLNTMADNLQQALVRLEDANTQLERDVEKERILLSERKELVDSLSHEMKTPLGIIRAYAEGLQDETDEAKKQKYVQVIVSEVERMNGLIVTLLDLSALESGAASLNISRFDFVELAETVAGRLLIDAPDTDFDLQYELPEQKAFVRTDRRRMEQVLDNLIVNAKKNVYPGGVLRLELTVDDGALHFSIFNQGRPIPESDLPKIWTKFYRDSCAEYSGSGLGLSIVAQILSMQNLPYGVENQAGGVRFYFSIPVTE